MLHECTRLLLDLWKATKDNLTFRNLVEPVIQKFKRESFREVALLTPGMYSDDNLYGFVSTTSNQQQQHSTAMSHNVAAAEPVLGTPN